MNILPGDIVQYTDGSKTKQRTVADINRLNPEGSSNISLEGYCTVFLAELRVSDDCIQESTQMKYFHKSIYILSDS